MSSLRAEHFDPAPESIPVRLLVQRDFELTFDIRLQAPARRVAASIVIGVELQFVELLPQVRDFLVELRSIVPPVEKDRVLGPELLGLRGVPSGAFPTFSIAGMRGLGAGTHERVQLPIRQQQYINSWTVVRGSHVMKIGGEVRRSSNLDILRTSISGNFNFAVQPTALEGAANTGFGLASIVEYLRRVSAS